MCECCRPKSSGRTWLFLLAIVCGIICGCSGITFLETLGKYCSEIFVKIFRCISMPIISLSVIVALSSYGSDRSMMRVWKRTLSYTIATTIAAATVAALLYVVISPQNVVMDFESSVAQLQTGQQTGQQTGEYSKYLMDIVPDSIISAFATHQVLSVLLISIIFGLSIRFIKESETKDTVISFFKGIHSIFFTITKFIVKILPIGMFGFIIVSVTQIRAGTGLKGMGSYFMVIIAANLLQGAIVLPALLLYKRISPVKVFRAMSPALSVAFFSKSSSAALPVTMETAETKLGVNPKVSRFVLPLCTTINMNGCAAFIFTTVVYIMQNYGVEITPLTMLSWILIATIAAVGNASVPMGCFFLSASLLSSMNVPMPLLGVILPVYSVIDMIETSLNVWSDTCVTTVINEEFED
jgi:Na+/H+-dicarboxylate symporter